MCHSKLVCVATPHPTPQQRANRQIILTENRHSSSLPLGDLCDLAGLTAPWNCIGFRFFTFKLTSQLLEQPVSFFDFSHHGSSRAWIPSWYQVVSIVNSTTYGCVSRLPRRWCYTFINTPELSDLKSHQVVIDAALGLSETASLPRVRRVFVMAHDGTEEGIWTLTV